MLAFGSSLKRGKGVGYVNVSHHFDGRVDWEDGVWRNGQRAGGVKVKPDVKPFTAANEKQNGLWTTTIRLIP
jgi:hypothetical protein